MKRKTLHNWFASSSNTPNVVPEPEATQIPNLNPLTPTNESSNPPTESTIPPTNESTNPTIDESTNQPPTPRVIIQEFHPSQIFGDPADRIPIEDYAPEIRSDVRRAYLLKGRNKAEGHNFEITLDGTIRRSFQPQWLDRFHWLEYSVKKEAAFCFHCFLFKKPSQAATFGNDVYTLHGYHRWKTALTNFQKHIGGPSSYHNNAIGLCDDFNNQRANVATRFRVYNKEAEIAYKIRLIIKMECFQFVFIMLFLINLLQTTNMLSQALQRKKHDVVEAMRLILDVKETLQDMRDNGYESLCSQAKIFCEEHGIDVPNMDDLVGAMGQSVRTKNKVTRHHYFKVSIFYVVIDATMTEMNHRFNEVNSELVDCMSCLNPANNFAKFNVDKLVRLAEIYADDFTETDRLLLRIDLPRFLRNIRRSEEFNGCSDVSTLALLMVQSTKHATFPSVYRLIELTLILPVATSSVERIFSAMKIIKTDLRNKISDDWLNDLMVCYCEKRIFKSIHDDQIMIQFQKKSDRKAHLPREYNVIA